MIAAALEYTTRGKRRPSEILPGLYLGGLDAVLNSKFLKSANVAGICTAAGGLDMFGPKWTRGRRKAREELGIEFLDLALRDDENQQVSRKALIGAVHFVHGHVGTEKSCLVHCAMGKSRSTMVVLAYLLSLPEGSPGRQSDVDTALAYVKTRRRMAQPNAGFMAQLKTFHREGVFQGILR